MHAFDEWSSPVLRSVDTPTSDYDDEDFDQSILFDLGYETATGEQLHWQDFALCAQTDPDIFFPEKGGSTTPATSVCSACPVRSQCLDYAISHDIRHGIWGGMSDNDRRRISRERRRMNGQGA
ncbi:WhiB family transcriptional regulator [Arcanobacterium haemolyticum]|nr:WhiB family transcriptional regulator [Arcanobacterium haemolyticum]